MKSDTQLKKDVIAELEWEPLVDAASIGVEVKNGIVTLVGYLDSYPEKFTAERAAQRVVGVKTVVIEIDVKIPEASRRTDSDIALAAIDALRWNVLVPTDHVKVKVEHGWITLSGDLEWDYQRAAAESTVCNLIAVKGVYNQIRIKPIFSPGNLKSKIEAALQRAAHFESKAISISADGGKVTIEGTVHSHAERALVESAAWASPGVSTVINRIKILD